MNILSSFADLNKEVLTQNLSCNEALSLGGEWEIYTQDGPCDETMLVRKDLNIAILKDDLFGMRKFSGEVEMIGRCGWIFVGTVDLTDDHGH